MVEKNTILEIVTLGLLGGSLILAILSLSGIFEVQNGVTQFTPLLMILLIFYITRVVPVI
ncbi:MAG: hypothetical protein ACTSR3_18475 [Candidatus Helarchaeota archaeon]